LRLIMSAACRKDVGFALSLGVHGLHVPQAALYAPARILGGITPGRPRRFPLQWILTASAHSRAAMVTASHRGFHAVLLSPVFPTTSHPDCATVGPLRFSMLTRNTSLPVYALGGIHAGNVRRLARSGAVGIAAIEGFALEGLAIPPPSP
jgi:thiamine monophosphate synthase